MKSRDSSIELLRLLCMVGIVLMHFIGLAVYPEVWNPSAPLTANVVAGTLVCSITILSVNIFGLISGYFGIHFSWRRLLILYTSCSLYALIGCCVGILFGETIAIKEWVLEILFPFSHASDGLWYIKCYVGLVLFVPLLNKAIESLNRNEYITTLILFTIANVYFGRFWKVPTYNIYGYSVAQLVYLYIIGGYIRRYISVSEIPHWWIVVTFVLCVAIWNILTIVQHRINVPHWSPTSYNHLVVLLASVCVLLLFLKHPFKRSWVNYIASGSIAIYLFHQNAHVWKILLAQLSSHEYFRNHWWGAKLCVLAIMLCFIIVLFDKLRQYLVRLILQK